LKLNNNNNNSNNTLINSIRAYHFFTIKINTAKYNVLRIEMYCIIKMVNLPLYLSSVDLLILLFSALSHDLDHPGFTNSYQINAGTWLALRYNDISPLENHHCMTAFDLINNNPTANIISGLTPNESRHFRRSVIRFVDLYIRICNYYLFVKYIFSILNITSIS
ncbi:unnamed protein product, partial [Schistosoma margrebowiei]